MSFFLTVGGQDTEKDTHRLRRKCDLVFVLTVCFLLLLQASNIDDVLCHHTSFLDNCLKDCMLTNPELLRIFSKLMSVCVKFTNCMQVCLHHDKEEMFAEKEPKQLLVSAP